MARILIIDDDDQVSAMLAEGLQDAGHTTARAAAAYGAMLRVIHGGPFDLVLMDLLLQGANGAVAALALRGLGYEGPIVVLTGGLLPIDQALYDRAGFSGRMLKPVLLRELLDEVSRQLPAEPGRA